MPNLASRLRQSLGLGGKGLSRVASRGVFWTLTQYGGLYSIRLVSTLVLTRLLAPEDFGLMSLATLTLALMALISDIGIRHSVIRSTREDWDFLATAWTLKVLRGLVIAIFACLLAWPMSVFYDEPMLWPMITVLALNSAIAGFQSVSMMTASRKMHLKRLAIIAISIKVLVTVVTIYFAWITASAWALVIGSLVGGWLSLAFSHLFLPRFRHRFRLERDAIREIFAYGSWILASTILHFLNGRGSNMIYGGLVATDVLGMIVIAGTIGLALVDVFGALYQKVAYPVLAKVNRERPHDVPKTVRRMHILVLSSALPLFIAVAFLAQEIVDLLYDDRYALAGTFLSLQAMNGALLLLRYSYVNHLLVTGESRLKAAVTAVTSVANILGLVIGYHLAGVVGMLAGAGFGHVVGAIYASYLAHRRGVASFDVELVSFTVVGAAYAFVLSSAL
jgi:O-antigen/teichoic acid export membrane protein